MASYTRCLECRWESSREGSKSQETKESERKSSELVWLYLKAYCPIYCLNKKQNLYPQIQKGQFQDSTKGPGITFGAEGVQMTKKEEVFLLSGCCRSVRDYYYLYHGQKKIPQSIPLSEIYMEGNRWRRLADV